MTNLKPEKWQFCTVKPGRFVLFEGVHTSFTGNCEKWTQKGISSRRRIKTNMPYFIRFFFWPQKGISSRRRIKTFTLGLQGCEYFLRKEYPAEEGLRQRAKKPIAYPWCTLRKEYPAEEGLRPADGCRREILLEVSERNIQQKKD